MTPEICPLLKTKSEFEKIEDFENRVLYRCSDCGVQFWWPLNKDVDKEFYQESEMYEFVEKRSPAWYHRQFLKNPPLNSGRLLDVGSGQGEFLNAAKELNFDLWGIDIAERNVEIVKRNYGLKNIYAQSLEEFVEREDVKKFDVITAFELLEHLPDPSGFMGLVKNILKPGGYIVISTPNLDRFGGVKEHWDYPPNHLFRWNKNTLEKFIQAKDFDIVKIVEQPFARDFFITRGTFSLGLIRYWRSKKEGRVIKKGLGLVKSGGPMVHEGKNPIFTRGLEILAKAKNYLLNIITIPAEFFLKLFGYKYWDLYIVARLK